jgi:hypothetical protein
MSPLDSNTRTWRALATGAEACQVDETNTGSKTKLNSTITSDRRNDDTSTLTKTYKTLESRHGTETKQTTEPKKTKTTYTDMRETDCCQQPWFANDS